MEIKSTYCGNKNRYFFHSMNDKPYFAHNVDFGKFFLCFVRFCSLLRQDNMSIM